MKGPDRQRLPLEGSSFRTDRKSNQQLRCQSIATNYNVGGDSGSPVFRPSSNPSIPVDVYGIMWGGIGTSQMLFSTILWAKAELDSFAIIDTQ